jgi:hypothetical protein
MRSISPKQRPPMRRSLKKHSWPPFFNNLVMYVDDCIIDLKNLRRKQLFLSTVSRRLFWQKLGSINWQGRTPYMTYQKNDNAGWQKLGSIKWQSLTPYIHH